MPTETNKMLAREFFRRLSGGDIAGTSAMLHDDVAWWSAGGENLAFSGVLGKTAFIEAVNGMTSIFSTGLELTPAGMVAEGDRIAVELSGHAVLHDGRAYDNLYHVLLTFDGGRIIAAREYHDTLYAKIVLVDGKASNPPV